MTTKTLTLKIGGMSCEHCVARVKNALTQVPGVSNIEVNLDTEQASLKYDPATAGLSDFRSAVANAGYEVLPAAE